MDITYTLIRSSRKTISLEIRPDGSILVRAPRHMRERAIREFVLSRESWLQPRLAKIQSRPTLPSLTEQEVESLKKQAKADLSDRVMKLAPRVGVGWGRISVRAQKSRWGSCTRDGNLNFNCLLMLCPEPVRDYVVIHELCHRKHMDHSPRFWTEVERACPEFRACKQWLKDNGSALIARLPQ